MYFNGLNLMLTGKIVSEPYLSEAVSQDTLSASFVEGFTSFAPSGGALTNLRYTFLSFPLASTYPPGELPSTQEGLRMVIGDVKIYIDEHLDQNLRLEQIAQEAHLSPFHFARIFRHLEGTSVWQYILQARIDKAKLLLEQEDLSLTEIALITGFYDQSHFTKTFKRLTGQTPGQYRAVFKGCK